MRFALLCAAALAFAGCKNEPVPVSRSAAAPAAAPTAAPAAAAQKQFAAGTAATAPLAGKVLETLEVDSYTYVKIATPAGEEWAAVPKAKVEVGSEVAIANAMLMQNFESKALNRKFERVYFGTLAGAGEAAAAGMPHGMGAMPAAAVQPAGHPAPTVPGDTGDIKVEKAAGPEGRTVAETYAQRAELKDKTVAVRGKVVKAMAVMGRTFLHLRDGTGSEAGKDNDLTVTTQAQVGVGETITAKGTLHLDKDFGAGYLYPVILEDAAVEK